MSESIEPQYDLKISPESRNRLKTRALMEGDETYEDVVTRLLDQTQVSISLDKFADRILESMDVAQLAIYEEPTVFEGNDILKFVVHTPDELGDLLDDVHAVDVAGETYRFSIHTSTFGPQTSGRITIYSSDDILGMDSVSVEEGLLQAKKWVAKHTVVPSSEKHAGLPLILND